MVKRKTAKRKTKKKVIRRKIRRNPDENRLLKIKRSLEEDDLKIKKIKLYNDYWELNESRDRSHTWLYMIKVQDTITEEEYIIMFYIYQEGGHNYWSGRLNDQEKEFAKKYNFI